MIPSCASRFILPALILSFVFILSGCGGGGGDDDVAQLHPPAFDLTGVWEQVDRPECEGNLMPVLLDILEGNTPNDLLTLTHIEQDGNDLTITVVTERLLSDDVEESFTATISGDQIHYEYEADLFGMSAYVTGEATALSDSHIEFAEQHETIDLDPGDTQVDIVCTGELVRADSP